MSRREEVDLMLANACEGCDDGAEHADVLGGECRTIADEVDERDAIIEKLLAMLKTEGRSPEDEDEITDLASLIHHAYNDYDGDQSQMKKMRDDTQQALRAAAMAVMNELYARACEIARRKD